MDKRDKIKNMKKYIICAPEYTHRSNGIKVLYRLADELQKRGYETYIHLITPKTKENIKYNFIESEEITDEMRANDIVVYPEIVFGNPLQFQNVVRYVLFYPGKNGGRKKYFKNETFFTFSKSFYNAKELYIPTIDLNIFCKSEEAKTTDAVFIYKGGKWKDIPELDNLPTITAKFPEEQKDLVELLQKTKTLYSYDDTTSLLDEAVLCGCNVKIIRGGGEKTDTKIIFPIMMLKQQKKFSKNI